MSIFSKLFSGGGAKEPEPEIYKEFHIFPLPRKEGGEYRLAARIEKEVGGEVKVHELVRADMIRDEETAKEAAIEKAKQMIDQMGEGLFR